MKWDWYKQLFSLTCELKEGSASAKVITEGFSIDAIGTTKAVMDLYKIRIREQKGGILAFFQGDLVETPLSVQPRIAIDKDLSLFFTLTCRSEFIKLLGTSFPEPGNPLCFSHTGVKSGNKLLLSLSSMPFFNPVPAELKNSLVLLRIDIRYSKLPVSLIKVTSGSEVIWKDQSAPQYSLRIVK